MKRRIITTLILTAVLLSAFAIPAMAKGNMNNDARPIEQFKNGAGRMIEPLNLTEEQMDKMQQMRFENQKWMIDMKAKLEHKMLELREYTHMNPNEKKALAVAEEIGKLRTEMEKNRISQHFKMRNLLTAEQKEIFDNMGFMGGMGHEHGMGPGYDMGPRGDFDGPHCK